MGQTMSDEQIEAVAQEALEDQLLRKGYFDDTVASVLKKAWDPTKFERLYIVRVQLEPPRLCDEDYEDVLQLGEDESNELLVFKKFFAEIEVIKTLGKDGKPNRTDRVLRRTQAMTHNQMTDRPELSRVEILLNVLPVEVSITWFHEDGSRVRGWQTASPVLEDDSENAALFVACSTCRQEFPLEPIIESDDPAVTAERRAAAVAKAEPALRQHWNTECKGRIVVHESDYGPRSIRHLWRSVSERLRKEHDKHKGIKSSKFDQHRIREKKELEAQQANEIRYYSQPEIYLGDAVVPSGAMETENRRHLIRTNAFDMKRLYTDDFVLLERSVRDQMINVLKESFSTGNPEAPSPLEALEDISYRDMFVRAPGEDSADFRDRLALYGAQLDHAKSTFEEYFDIIKNAFLDELRKNTTRTWQFFFLYTAFRPDVSRDESSPIPDDSPDDLSPEERELEDLKHLGTRLEVAFKASIAQRLAVANNAQQAVAATNGLSPDESREKAFGANASPDEAFKLAFEAWLDAKSRAAGRVSELQIDHAHRHVEIAKQNRLEDEARELLDPSIEAGKEFAATKQSFLRFHGLHKSYGWFELKDIFCEACVEKHNAPDRPVEYDIAQMDTQEYSPALDCPMCAQLSPRFLDVRKGEIMEILQKNAWTIPSPKVIKQRKEDWEKAQHLHQLRQMYFAERYEELVARIEAYAARATESGRVVRCTLLNRNNANAWNDIGATDELRIANLEDELASPSAKDWKDILDLLKACNLAAHEVEAANAYATTLSDRAKNIRHFYRVRRTPEVPIDESEPFAKQLQMLRDLDVGLVCRDLLERPDEQERGGTLSAQIRPAEPIPLPHQQPFFVNGVAVAEAPRELTYRLQSIDLQIRLAHPNESALSIVRRKAKNKRFDALQAITLSDLADYVKKIISMPEDKVTTTYPSSTISGDIYVKIRDAFGSLKVSADKLLGVALTSVIEFKQEKEMMISAIKSYKPLMYEEPPYAKRLEIESEEDAMNFIRMSRIPYCGITKHLSTDDLKPRIEYRIYEGTMADLSNSAPGESRLKQCVLRKKQSAVSWVKREGCEFMKAFDALNLQTLQVQQREHLKMSTKIRNAWRTYDESVADIESARRGLCVVCFQDAKDRHCPKCDHQKRRPFLVCSAECIQKVWDEHSGLHELPTGCKEEIEGGFLEKGEKIFRGVPQDPLKLYALEVSVVSTRSFCLPSSKPDERRYLKIEVLTVSTNKDDRGRHIVDPETLNVVMKRSEGLEGPSARTSQDHLFLAWNSLPKPHGFVSAKNKVVKIQRDATDRTRLWDEPPAVFLMMPGDRGTPPLPSKSIKLGASAQDAFTLELRVSLWSQSDDKPDECLWWGTKKWWPAFDPKNKARPYRYGEPEEIKIPVPLGNSSFRAPMAPNRSGDEYKHAYDGAATGYVPPPDTDELLAKETIEYARDARQPQEADIAEAHLKSFLTQYIRNEVTLEVTLHQIEPLKREIEGEWKIYNTKRDAALNAQSTLNETKKTLDILKQAMLEGTEKKKDTPCKASYVVLFEQRLHLINEAIRRKLLERKSLGMLEEVALPEPQLDADAVVLPEDEEKSQQEMRKKESRFIEDHMTQEVIESIRAEIFTLSSKVSKASQDISAAIKKQYEKQVQLVKEGRPSSDMVSAPAGHQEAIRAKEEERDKRKAQCKQLEELLERYEKWNKVKANNSPALRQQLMAHMNFVSSVLTTHLSKVKEERTKLLEERFAGCPGILHVKVLSAHNLAAAEGNFLPALNRPYVRLGMYHSGVQDQDKIEWQRTMTYPKGNETAVFNEFGVSSRGKVKDLWIPPKVCDLYERIKIAIEDWRKDADPIEITNGDEVINEPCLVHRLVKDAFSLVHCFSENRDPQHSHNHIMFQLYDETKQFPAGYVPRGDGKHPRRDWTCAICHKARRDNLVREPPLNKKGAAAPVDAWAKFKYCSSCQLPGLLPEEPQRSAATLGLLSPYGGAASPYNYRDKDLSLLSVRNLPPVPMPLHDTTPVKETTVLDHNCFCVHEHCYNNRMKGRELAWELLLALFNETFVKLPPEILFKETKEKNPEKAALDAKNAFIKHAHDLESTTDNAVGELYRHILHLKTVRTQQLSGKVAPSEVGLPTATIQTNLEQALYFIKKLELDLFMRRNNIAPAEVFWWQSQSKRTIPGIFGMIKEAKDLYEQEMKKAQLPFLVLKGYKKHSEAALQKAFYAQLQKLEQDFADETRQVHQMYQVSALTLYAFVDRIFSPRTPEVVPAVKGAPSAAAAAAPKPVESHPKPSTNWLGEAIRLHIPAEEKQDYARRSLADKPAYLIRMCEERKSAHTNAVKKITAGNERLSELVFASRKPNWDPHELEKFNKRRISKQDEVIKFQWWGKPDERLMIEVVSDMGEQEAPLLIGRSGFIDIPTKLFSAVPKDDGAKLHKHEQHGIYDIIQQPRRRHFVRALRSFADELEYYRHIKPDEKVVGVKEVVDKLNDLEDNKWLHFTKGSYYELCEPVHDPLRKGLWLARDFGTITLCKVIDINQKDRYDNPMLHQLIEPEEKLFMDNLQLQKAISLYIYDSQQQYDDWASQVRNIKASIKDGKLKAERDQLMKIAEIPIREAKLAEFKEKVEFQLKKTHEAHTSGSVRLLVLFEPRCLPGTKDWHLLRQD